jgi:Mg-chelatase subunit ChlD
MPGRRLKRSRVTSRDIRARRDRARLPGPVVIRLVDPATLQRARRIVAGDGTPPPDDTRPAA